MFEKFADYMYYLLHSPLKKIAKTQNQFYILFSVIGKLFDRTKDDIMRVRLESMIISANEDFLALHGYDRNRPRYRDESLEDYRKRLILYNLSAEKSGTLDGILVALSAIGYDKSTIEPYYLTDPTRWAEFIVYLHGDQQSSIDDLLIIDAEVMRVKQASSKPVYAIGPSSVLQLDTSASDVYVYDYPICNVLICNTGGGL